MQSLLYNDLKEIIKNKDDAVTYYLDYYLNVTQSIFTYEGLPETIPQSILEYMLQTNGNVFITNVNECLYAFNGGLGGEPDEYYRPTIITVSNPKLNLFKDYNIGIDGVLLKNDYKMAGIMPIIGKYAVLLTDAIISLNLSTILSRLSYLISASDDYTKQSADTFISKISNGDFSIVGENAFFDGVKLQSVQNQQSQLTQLIEVVQYYKSSLLNELGLDSNYNLKRERLTAGEVAQNVDVLLPFIDNMLTCRREGVQKVNEMFGTEIEVNLASAWKGTHAQEDAITKMYLSDKNELIHNTEPEQELAEPEQELAEPEQELAEPEQELAEPEQECPELKKGNENNVN